MLHFYIYLCSICRNFVLGECSKCQALSCTHLVICSHLAPISHYPRGASLGRCIYPKPESEPDRDPNPDPTIVHGQAADEQGLREMLGTEETVHQPNPDPNIDANRGCNPALDLPIALFIAHGTHKQNSYARM